MVVYNFHTLVCQNDGVVFHFGMVVVYFRGVVYIFGGVVYIRKGLYGLIFQFRGFSVVFGVLCSREVWGGVVYGVGGLLGAVVSLFVLLSIFNQVIIPEGFLFIIVYREFFPKGLYTITDKVKHGEGSIFFIYILLYTTIV